MESNMDKFFNAEEARKRSESKLDATATAPWLELVFKKINAAIDRGERFISCPFSVWIDDKSMPINIEKRIRQRLALMGYKIVHHHVEPSSDPRERSYDTLEW